MRIIFYNLVSITIGIILIFFGIRSLLKSQKKVFPILTLVHSLFFLGFGIAGFIIPEEYSFLVILAMLAFTITLILCFLLWGKKEPDGNKKSAPVRKEKALEVKKEEEKADASIDSKEEEKNKGE